MILMYHKIDLVSPTKWWVNANSFYKQMHEIANSKVVYLDEYDPNNDSHVVITFDGIYKNVLEFALPILQYFDYPFELFLTSDYLDKDNAFDTVEPLTMFTSAEELKVLVKGKGRLQWHTKSHINLKNVKDKGIIASELNVPENIRDLDKSGFNWFAYPHGEFNNVVINEVKKRFTGALSCNQGNDYYKYVYNRLTVVNSTRLNNLRVACIIASYNYGSYLIEAIESVLNQTILPDEILITDDCSDDDTQIISEAYIKKYPQLIKYNRNNENLGIVDNFNKSILLTDSEFVFFLGADNRILSNYIEECRLILDENKNVGIAYTDYALFDSRAKLIYDKYNPEWRGEIIEDVYYKINFPEYDNRETLLSNLEKKNFIHGSSMFKRKAFDEVGGYLQTNKPEDYNLFQRIISQGWNAKKIKKTSLEYRQHSISQANNAVTLQNQLNFYKRQYSELTKKKTIFENTMLYRVSFFFFRFFKFIRKNYTKPKKVFSYIIKFLK
jgi:glycosyltransferase involved in cell wall biosynthesis